MHDDNRHIERRPGVMGGRPVIRGTRLTVHNIAVRVAGGETYEEIADDYGYVSVDQLRAAVAYARRHPERSRSSRPWWRRLV